jgi:EAL domain-containing protein (putative c-di-GMP-specific phosphodiesterase class I)
MASMSQRSAAPPVTAGCDELRRAIDDGELAAWYQPVIRLSDGVVTGFEAFVRWPRPDGTTTPASDIIPLAAACGLVSALDDWVRREVFRQLALWQDDALVSHGFHVAINMSGLELDDDALPQRVTQAIDAAAVDPRGLVIELTDTNRIKDVATAKRVIAELRALGVDVALDDVGSEHARFDLLRALPFNVLKIDRAVVEASDTPIGAALTRALVELGQNLNVRIHAGGVETIDQADRLRRLGCHDGQGFLWMPALPAHEAEQLLTACQPLQPRP